MCRPNKDFNNTIVNYTNKFDINSEILLIIHADFDLIDLKNKNLPPSLFN
jgi:hypothetical protein